MCVLVVVCLAAFGVLPRDHSRLGRGLLYVSRAEELNCAGTWRHNAVLDVYQSPLTTERDAILCDVVCTYSGTHLRWMGWVARWCVWSCLSLICLVPG